MSENILEKQLIDIIQNKEIPENIKLAKVDMLIKLGVDVNTLYSAKSALLMAKEKGLKDVALFLEEQGAREFFNKGKEEKLSQELVSECYQDDCELDRIKELIIKGADVNAKNKLGTTAMVMAKDDEMRKITIEAVKKRNDKAGENVVIQGVERE